MAVSSSICLDTDSVTEQSLGLTRKLTVRTMLVVTCLAIAVPLAISLLTISSISPGALPNMMITSSAQPQPPPGKPDDIPLRVTVNMSEPVLNPQDVPGFQPTALTLASEIVSGKTASALGLQNLLAATLRTLHAIFAWALHSRLLIEVLATLGFSSYIQHLHVIIASKDRTRHAELAAAAASAAHAATVANQEKELAWSAVRVAALQQVADKQRIAADQTIILELRAAQSLYITCTQAGFFAWFFHSANVTRAGLVKLNRMGDIKQGVAPAKAKSTNYAAHTEVELRALAIQKFVEFDDMMHACAADGGSGPQGIIPTETDLRGWMENIGLPISGTKPAVVRRLLAAKPQLYIYITRHVLTVPV